MQQVDAAHFFAGSGLILAPHMDDEALACGGTLALLPQKASWHVAYATDGSASPEPVIPWRDRVSADLSAVRREEAIAAMSCLGLPPANLHFLDLPDGKLARHRDILSHHLRSLLGEIKPDHILVPFRYDGHSDHLALNWALRRVQQDGSAAPTVTDYFVYYRWRMLPGGDVRDYIRPELVKMVDTSSAAGQKRAALDCFKSQTTRFFSWQGRPNLTPEFLDAVSEEPECFLRADPSMSGATVFERSATWIRVAHRLEPFLKKRKDRLFALWRRTTGNV